MAQDRAVRVTTREESAVVRRLEVEVAKDRVNAAFDRAYRDLAKRAQVKGFRKGKVPRPVLEKMFGLQVGEEIERLLVTESLGDALEEAEVRPVTEPSIDAGPPQPDTAYTYTAVIEVKPGIELPELTGLPATRPSVDVSEQEFLEQLEQIREGQAQLLEEAEDAEAVEGHHLKIDFVGRIDGEAFEGGTGNGVDVELGTGRFIPGFEEQLIGVKAGDDVEIRVNFPDDYGAEELAGKEAVFATHVVSIHKREVPELDDELARDLGDFDDLDALRAKVREDLGAQRQNAAEAALRQSVLDALVERTQFDVPAGLIERRLQGQLQRAHQELEKSMPHDQLNQQLDAWRESWRPRAERDVREALLLEAVSAEREIEVSEEELEAKMNEMAETQGVDAKRLKQAYQQGELAEALSVQMKDEKALAFLCSEAKIEETSDT